MAVGNIKIQMIWGIALILMGIAVFYRVPQIMPRIAQIDYFSSSAFFIRFCFYVIGVMLIGGGIRKLVLELRPKPKDTAKNPPNGPTSTP